MNDLDDFKYPRRKPWLLIVLVLVVGAVFLARRVSVRSGRQPKPEKKPAGAPAVETAAAVSSPAPVPQDLAGLARNARALYEKGDLAGAREAYLAIYEKSRGTALRAEIERILGEIGIQLATTPLAMPEKEDYVVQRGDSVEKIARKFGTTVELIRKSNQLANPNLIKAGDRLKILKGKFGIEVSKSRSDMVVLLNDRFFKRYRVGTGKFGKTPVGTFEVSDRIVEPVWWRPDGKEVPFGHPENILGTRWLAIRAKGNTQNVQGYGIHGTWADETIGKAESAGCIRMHNKDVEELYDLVPLRTEVRITE